MRERYLIVWCALAAAAGIYGGSLWEASLGWSAAAMCLLAAASGASLFAGRRKVAWALCLVFMCAAGWVRMGLAGEDWQQQSHSLYGAEGRWTAVIDEEALTAGGSDPYIRYSARGERIRYADGTERDVRGHFFIYVPWDGKTKPLPPDTAVEVQGRISDFRFYKNPGKLDLESRYRGDHRIGRIYTETASAVMSRGSAGVFPLEAAAHRVKEWVREKFSPCLDPGRLPLLMTLLFGGSYQELPEGVLDAFTRIGIVHILSVSGSHIALLFGFLCLFGRWMRLPDRIVIPVSIAVILVYAGLSGFVPPVVRASLMGILSVIGMFFHREKEGILLLGAAVIGMLLWNPFYLFDVSFQLSVGASSGILLFYQPLLSGFRRVPYVPRWVREGAAVAIAAQVLTVPVVLYDFHVLPVYFLPANLIVTPLLEWTIIGGLGAALLIGWIGPLDAGILYGTDYLLWAAIRLSEMIARLPSVSANIGSLAAPGVFLYYACLLWLLLYLHRKRAEARYWGMAALPVLLLWNGWGWYQRPDAEFFVPDLGVSRGAVLRDECHCIVYYREGGLPIDMGERELRSVLGYKGIFGIDVLLLDLSRSRGASSFTLDIPIREIWMDRSSTAAAKPFLQTHPESRVRILADGTLTLRSGMTARKEGRSWLLAGKNGIWYLDGGGSVMERPDGPLFWLGGAESFQTLVDDDKMEVLHPDAAVYAGSSSPAAGEDRDYFILHDIPWADPSQQGMVTLRHRGRSWEMETYLPKEDGKGDWTWL